MPAGYPQAFLHLIAGRVTRNASYLRNLEKMGSPLPATFTAGAAAPHVSNRVCMKNPSQAEKVCNGSAVSQYGNSAISICKLLATSLYE